MNIDGSSGMGPQGPEPDPQLLLQMLSQGGGGYPPGVPPDLSGGIPSAPGPMGPGFPPPPQFQPPPPPLPPEPIALPDELSPDFCAIAFRYVTAWCRESRAFVKRKQPEWEEALKIWQGKIGIRELMGVKTSATSRSRSTTIDDDDDNEGLSDFVFPISPACMALASNTFNAIFSGPDAITVVSEDSPDSPVDGFTVAQKIQRLFLRKLEEGGIYQNVFMALLMWPVLGHVMGKVFWSHSSYFTRLLDRMTGQLIEDEHVIRSCPVIQSIPLDRVLIDWRATNSDLQTHRGIGHRVLRTYDEITATFASGGYFLNEEEVSSRWSRWGSSAIQSSDDMTADPQTQSITDPVSNYLEVWEWHGRIPFRGRLIESCCTLVTEPGVESPEAGVMVRLSERPALACGLRPLVNTPYIPALGQPFGISMRESVKDVHHMLSQSFGQFQDGIRFSVQNASIARRGGEVAAQIKEYGAIQPGTVFESDDPTNEVIPFPRGDFPAHALIQETQELKDFFQQVTHSSETYQGLSSSRQTATGMTILQNQSAQPATTLGTLFVRNYLQPAIDLALALLQTNTLQDQQIVVQGDAGTPIAITVTADEIQSGKFRAVVTMTNQDQMATAKAQSIERILQNAPSMMPLFDQKGWDFNAPELFLRYLDLIRIDGTDRIMRKRTPEEQQMLQMQAMQQAMMQQGPPGSDQDPSPPTNQGTGPGQLVTDGGPMGQMPTDMNALAQLLQQQSYSGAPNSQTPL